MSMTSDTELRVRYAETDQMGVAYYGSHFVWFEVGRTEYCRARGFNYADMERETGLYMVVVEAACRYRSSVRYDDVVLIRTSLTLARRRLLRFHYVVSNKGTGKPVAEGETTHLLTDRNGKPHLIPESVLQALTD